MSATAQLAQSPAARPATLPTARLVGVAWAACAAVALLWIGGAAAAALVTDVGADVWRHGPIAGALVGTTSTLAILSLRPWRPRAIGQWPFVWMGGSGVRFALTLAGAFLLYSAPFAGQDGLWWAVAVMATYAATLVGETRVYAASMRRFAPSPPPPSSEGTAPDPD